MQARRWLPGRALVLVADRGFAALELLAALGRHRITCITRLRLDAALYDPAPPRLQGTNGRPRTKGARLPNLSEVLANAGTSWQRVVVPGWYGEGERAVDLCSDTAVWCHAGLPIVPVRWVLVRDPLGRFDPQALLCTDPAQDPTQIVRWFAQRWQVEVTFQETRAHPGVETQRQWSDRAIARTTPCLLALFSLVTLLAARLNPSERSASASSAWVSQAPPNLQRHLRRRPPPCLAQTGFADIMAHWQGRKTRSGALKRARLRHLPRHIMAKVELRGQHRSRHEPSESDHHASGQADSPGGEVYPVPIRDHSAFWQMAFWQSF